MHTCEGNVAACSPCAARMQNGASDPWDSGGNQAGVQELRFLRTERKRVQLKSNR
jgi:hypothetical protein